MASVHSAIRAYSNRAYRNFIGSSQAYFYCFQALHLSSSTNGSATSRGFTTATTTDITGKPTHLYECLQCTYKSKWFSTIRRHVATHGERNISCYFCDAKFCTDHSLTIHMSGVHRLRNAECNCGCCGMPFTTTGLLRDHLRKVHGHQSENGNNYKCGKCSDVFQESIQLQVHWANQHWAQLSLIVHSCHCCVPTSISVCHKYVKCYETVTEFITSDFRFSEKHFRFVDSYWTLGTRQKIMFMVIL